MAEILGCRPLDNHQMSVLTRHSFLPLVVSRAKCQSVLTSSFGKQHLFKSGEWNDFGGLCHIF